MNPVKRDRQYKLRTSYRQVIRVLPSQVSLYPLHEEHLKLSPDFWPLQISVTSISICQLLIQDGQKDKNEPE